MISPNYQISFESKLTNKFSPEVLHPNNTRMPIPQETNASDIDNGKIYSNKSTPITKLLGFFGMLLGSLATFTGIKKLISRPTAANKKLTELLESRLTNVNSLIKNMREFCEYTYENFSKEITIIKPTVNLKPDISKYQTELATTENVNSVFAVENKYLDALHSWLETELKENNSTETISIVQELQTQLSTKISKYKQVLLKNIQLQENIDNIPKKLTKGSQAKKIIENFQEILNERKELLNEAQNHTDTLIGINVQAFKADRQKISGQLMADEKLLSQNFLNEVQKKLTEISISSNTTKNSSDTKALQPISLSASIPPNPILEFILKKDKTPQDNIEFISNMSETMNLKDIKILAERLYLRSKAGMQQFTTLANNANELYQQCNELLLKMFEDSGKNINLGNININEIETASLRFSRAFGYKSIREMITDLLIKYNHRPEISESKLAEIYKRFNEKFIENSTSDTIKIKLGDNLFNWSTLE